MNLLPSRRVLCTPYNHDALCHFMQSHTRKVHGCLTVTCHLHVWQNDGIFYVLVRELEGRTDTEIRVITENKLTLEKNVPLLFLQEFEPAIFQSLVRRSKPLNYPCSPFVAYIDADCRTTDEYDDGRVVNDADCRTTNEYDDGRVVNDADCGTTDEHDDGRVVNDADCRTTDEYDVGRVVNDAYCRNTGEYDDGRVVNDADCGTTDEHDDGREVNDANCRTTDEHDDGRVVNDADRGTTDEHDDGREVNDANCRTIDEYGDGRVVNDGVGGDCMVIIVAKTLVVMIDAPITPANGGYAAVAAASFLLMTVAMTLEGR